MINGPARFNLYLDRLEEFLIEAAKQSDAAEYLYKNSARTPVFMLEGLSRLYRSLHNKKKFTKLERHFKQLEDALGAIDYYDNFAKEFAKDQSVEPEFANAVAKKAEEKTAELNQILTKKRWLGEGSHRIWKARRSLHKADWLKDQAEIQAIEERYEKEIKETTAFADQYSDGFTDLESQVHELRRKLRWLSIYPQALQGAVQLDATPTNDETVAKYLTPDIVNSPFNKMPETGTNQYVLMFNRDYFLALSWMIAELGKLKDMGLRAVVLKEVGAPPATVVADESEILAKASDTTRTYFQEKNLDKLISGIVKTGHSVTN